METEQGRVKKVAKVGGGGEFLRTGLRPGRREKRGYRRLRQRHLGSRLVLRSAWAADRSSGALCLSQALLFGSSSSCPRHKLLAKLNMQDDLQALNEWESVKVQVSVSDAGGFVRFVD